MSDELLTAYLYDGYEDGVQLMREATREETESVTRYIKSISENGERKDG